MSLRPLIAICGTTGVGKSDFAVQLALRIKQGGFKHGWRGAKIINADSMQVYEGLNVITNKMPMEERKDVEHLLMDFKKPGEQYVIGQWVQDAIKLINMAHESGEIPIVVGGTSYWIQHLVFADRLIGSSQLKDPSTPPQHPKPLDAIVDLDDELRKLFFALPKFPPSAKTDPDASFKLHNLLNALDPVMASRWHWRDTRKVLRSLKIIQETGKKASDIVAEQNSRSMSSEPRYQTLFYWLYAEPSILEKRLYDRVDRMLEMGLVDEIHTLKKIASEESSKEVDDVDYTNGIYQAIGYKEFHYYLSNQNQGPEVTEFSEALDRMKLSTRQYAKRQVSWIRNKLLPVVYANQSQLMTPLFLLDATETGDHWINHVQAPGIKLMEDFLNEEELPEAHTLSEKAQQMLSVKKTDVTPISILEAYKKVVCTVCTVDEARPVMIQQGMQWESHLQTRSHRRLVKKADRRKQIVNET